MPLTIFKFELLRQEGASLEAVRLRRREEASRGDAEGAAAAAFLLSRGEAGSEKYQSYSTYRL